MRPRARFLFPLLLAAACGGNVIVDADGGTSNGGAATTSATDALCVTACNAIDTQCPSNSPDGGCAATCPKVDAAFKAECPQQYEAFLTCIAANPGELCGSTTTNVCSAEISAFANCDMVVCSQTPSPCQ
jgi:hypothetical protein